MHDLMPFVHPPPPATMSPCRPTVGVAAMVKPAPIKRRADPAARPPFLEKPARRYAITKFSLDPHAMKYVKREQERIDMDGLAVCLEKQWALEEKNK